MASFVCFYRIDHFRSMLPRFCLREEARRVFIDCVEMSTLGKH